MVPRQIFCGALTSFLVTSSCTSWWWINGLNDRKKCLEKFSLLKDSENEKEKKINEQF